MPSACLGALQLLGEVTAETLAFAVGSRSHHKPHDEAIQAKRLGEDEDENDAHEEARLLRVGADAIATISWVKNVARTSRYVALAALCSVKAT